MSANKGVFATAGRWFSKLWGTGLRARCRKKCFQVLYSTEKQLCWRELPLRECYCRCPCPGGEDSRQTLVLLRSVTDMLCLPLHNNPDASEERCGSPLPWQTSLAAALLQISHSLLREEGRRELFIFLVKQNVFLTLLKENETNNHPSSLNHKMEGQVKLGLRALKRKAVLMGEAAVSSLCCPCGMLSVSPLSLDKHHLLHSHIKTS